MNKTELFDAKIDVIKDKFNDLLKCREIFPRELLSSSPKYLSISGIYAFSEISGNQELTLYVGQSINILNRLGEHCAVRNAEKANFAYKLTVEKSGLKPIPGTPNSSRSSMFTIPEFEQCFNRTIEEVKNLIFRWVEVEDKLEKNLLEIYASVVLSSKYNEFEQIRNFACNKE